MWKFYEHLVQAHTAKDDLIQLFGYYQYKSSYALSMTVSEVSLQTSAFWRIVRQITNGTGVGQIYPVGEISDLLGVAQAELTETLGEMKTIGYEIRNHRTNKQIPAGYVLVPYAFPTLNERSLQRLTRL